MPSMGFLRLLAAGKTFGDACRRLKRPEVELKDSGRLNKKVVIVCTPPLTLGSGTVVAKIPLVPSAKNVANVS